MHISFRITLFIAILLGAALSSTARLGQAQPSFTKSTIQSTYKPSGTAMVDIDNDGDIDILVTSNDISEVAWWENTTGLGTSWTKRVIDSSFSGAKDPQGADIDGDGDLDAVAIANGNKDIAWWENTSGDGTTWSKTSIENDFNTPYAIHVKDLDGDGDFDVLAAGAGDKEVAWFENTAGDGSAWTEHTIATSFDKLRTARAIDIDGDGDLDVLASGHSSDELAWWENTSGNATTWSKSIIEASYGEIWGVRGVDIDGDSDLDVVAIENSVNELTWWENTSGNGTAWTKSVISGSINTPEALHVADLDNDGDSDILTSQAGDKGLDWWENTAGDGSSWQERSISTDFYALAVTAGDVDGDGFTDIAAGSEDKEELAWWENDSVALPTTGPGGVVTNQSLWLKADTGISESGGDVSAWADQSGNGYNATQGTSSLQPDYQSDALNYNPGVQFDGSDDYLNTSLDINAGTIPDIAIISVYETLVDNAGAPWGEDDGSWDRYIWDVSDPDDGEIGAGTTSETTTGLFITNSPIVSTVEYDEDATNGSSVFANGTLLTQFTANQAPESSNNFDIGWISSSTPFNGYIYELVVLSQTVTTQERNKIESYLALKYGITLGHDYLSSDATTLWDATTNATYHNDVVGIGRDDDSDLNQKQSTASIFAVGLGALAADNASNANTFSSDLTFLLLGHDSGTLTESSVTIGAYDAQLLGRKWFAEETGDAGTLEVQFDLTSITVSGTTSAEFQLVLDTDTDPTNGTRQIISANSFTSNIASFTNVDIQDNDYVMLLTDYDLTPVGGGVPLVDGVAADGVLGQPDFDSSAKNNSGLSSQTLSGPTFIALGPTGKIFVADSQNHRVLRWSSANATIDGSAADAVLGQADFTSNQANRGGSVAANTFDEPSGLFVTSSGALYVSDSRNHRILRFDNAESISSGAAADGVLGQIDFTSSEENRRKNVAANSLRWPKDLYVDSGGRLWVSDWLNHRVLRYDNVAAKADGADADGVLGQEVFTTRSQMWQDLTDADSFVYPSGVYVDGSGRLWVNDSGNSRVLRFDNAAAIADGADADAVLGQEDFTSWRVNRRGYPAANTIHWPDSGIDGDNQGRIWVADRWGDRVLWYDDAATKADGADADGVIGQPSFVSKHGFVDDDTFNSVHDVFIDTGNEYIWVIDNAHNRVLRFEAAAATISQAPKNRLTDVLDLWLKADEDVYEDWAGKDLAEDMDEVYIWKDQSNHAFTAITSSPPFFAEKRVNDHPAIIFEDPNALMNIRGGISGQTTLKDAALFAVFSDAQGEPQLWTQGTEFQSTYKDESVHPVYRGLTNRDRSPIVEEVEFAAKDFYLGSINELGVAFQGAVAELIVSYQQLSLKQQLQLASYMALKYGLQLNNSYMQSAGDTIWDASANAIYHHGIAGIGRDDAMSLNQQRSISAVKGSLLQMSLKSERADSLDDGFVDDLSFLVWGHNDAIVSFNVPTYLVDAAYRMERIWKVEEVGRVDTITVSIPRNIRAEYLLLSKDASFIKPTIMSLSEAIDEERTALIDFGGNQYLTFAAREKTTVKDSILPRQFALHQNYPNPFNPVTKIEFDLPESAKVQIAVYDLLGRQIRVLLDSEMPAGRHQTSFDASGIASGVYFYRMKTARQEFIHKMLLAK